MEKTVLEKFLYICPACEKFDSLETKKGNRTICAQCETEYSFDGNFELSAKKGDNIETHSLKEWYKKIADFELTGIKDDGFNNENGERLLARSGKSIIFKETIAGMFKGFRDIRARLYKFRKLGEGLLYLSDKRMVFKGEDEIEIAHFELSSVTIESHMVIMNTKRGYAYSFEFLEESGKKWEDLIRRAVTGFYGDKEIREFHPRITFY